MTYMMTPRIFTYFSLNPSFFILHSSFFILQSIGEFVLTDPDMRVKPRGKIYSINEGYTQNWDKAIQEYVASKKTGPKPYGARYVGSMVADVHRTLKYGGIFMYPATTDAPSGKLRLLYEAVPMAFIMEQAGGLASTGAIPILEVQPEKLHQRVPVILGSKEDVEEVLEVIKRHSQE